jgi:membrane protein implicated in regulation of membrane protease activity
MRKLSGAAVFNSMLVKRYFETQLEMYRLKVVRLVSKSAGYFFWMIISAFLVFLFFIFLGVAVGLWLGHLTGSYIAGFAITAAAILVVIILSALLRNALFINPLVRRMVRHSEEPFSEKKGDQM